MAHDEDSYSVKEFALFGVYFVTASCEVGMINTDMNKMRKTGVKLVVRNFCLPLLAVRVITQTLLTCAYVSPGKSQARVQK